MQSASKDDKTGKSPSKSTMKDNDDKWVDSNDDEEEEMRSDTSDSNSTSSEDEDFEEGNEQKEVTVQVSSAFLDSLIIRLMSAKPKVGPSSSDDKSNTSKNKKGAARSESINSLPIQVDIQYDEIKQLCDLACESFKRQKSLIYLDKSHLPVIVCGDIHGQFQNLREIFFRCGSPHRQSYLFLGDYVDRGSQGILTVVLLLALKIKYPTKVFLLRGNHESSQTNLSYGFYDECQERFIATEDNLGEAVWKTFVEVFNHMPFASVIEKAIFCVHGGLSPDLNSLEDIEKIERPCIVPPYGLACDLLWSDPKVSPSRDGWSMSIRGMSFSFNSRIIAEFCDRLKIDLFVRGHQMLNTAQMMNNGFAFFPGGRLITLFSARNYTNICNAGAVMRVSPTVARHVFSVDRNIFFQLKCRFIVFRMNKHSRLSRKRPPKTYLSEVM